MYSNQWHQKRELSINKFCLPAHYIFEIAHFISSKFKITNWHGGGRKGIDYKRNSNKELKFLMEISPRK